MVEAVKALSEHAPGVVISFFITSVKCYWFSGNLLNNVSFFQVKSPNILSDHCIIDFDFTFNHLVCTDNDFECETTEDNLHTTHKFVWDDDLKDNFVFAKSYAETVNKLQSFNDHISNAVSENDIDECIHEFTKIISSAALPLQRKCTSIVKTTCDLNCSNNQL